jgi:hypothetical protein
MCTVALFTMAEMCRQSKYSSMDEQNGNIYTMEDYSTERKNEIMSFTGK